MLPNTDSAFGIADRMILDHLTTAVLLFDSTLSLRTMNPSAEMLLDVSLNQVRGQPYAVLFAQMEPFLSALERVRDSGHPLTEREMRIAPARGGEVTVDCVMTPVAEDDGPPAVLVEIIGLARHTQVTRESRLVAESEAARALVRGLAHEIRNPLGGLRGAAQLLEREVQGETLKEYTQVIIGEADRLQKLLDRMLGPRTMPHRRPVNVHEVTERVCALLRAEAPATVTIARDYDPSIPDLNADPELLIQATLNVARNAVQAVSQAGGHIEVRTRIGRQLTIGQRHHRLAVRLEVSDNGPGIEEQIREKVFYPMVTGRPDGLGLGLSIAQTLINQHGGLIECESRPGATTFSILLPVDDSDQWPGHAL